MWMNDMKGRYLCGMSCAVPRPNAVWRPFFVSFRRVLNVLVLFALVAATGVAQSRAPSSSDPVEVWGVMQDDNSYRFYARNDHFIPVYISVSFAQLTSLAPDQDLPWRGAIQPGTEEQYLFSLLPTTSRGRIGYSLTYTFAEGDPETADHDDDYLYLFPFAHGTKHRITQGHNGTFSHFGENQYAIDFDLDEGTPVFAARGGIVVRVKEDGRAGGPSMAYADRGNVIMIAHDDGSFGNYVHLRYRGAEVAVGDRVEPGDLIGYSGNTGVSSGPHLHFDVRVPLATGRMQSIPFRFRGVDGNAVDPREGDIHYATHPGGEPFEMVFGADLVPADFADHREPIGASNRIEFRSEQYDLTYAVFVGNGFAEEIEATITFSLVNMRAEGTFPMRVRIPPRTELFVTLLRADPGGDRWQYAPSVTYRRVN
jgi:murein DD-endopeptidase MepM/ murein hydrolase activator NlpD